MPKIGQYFKFLVLKKDSKTKKVFLFFFFLQSSKIFNVCVCAYVIQLWVLVGSLVILCYTFSVPIGILLPYIFLLFNYANCWNDIKVYAPCALFLEVIFNLICPTLESTWDFRVHKIIHFRPFFVPKFMFMFLLKFFGGYIQPVVQSYKKQGIHLKQSIYPKIYYTIAFLKNRWYMVFFKKIQKVYSLYPPLHPCMQ